MNPPLRTEADRRALIEGLRSGTIDCVATDHAPHARDEKEVPFEQAPMGTTGLETAFAALHTELVVPGVLPLGLLVERLTAGGALFGLAVPRIAVGEPANLVLVDLDAEWEVGEDGYETPLGELLLRGPAAARARAAHARRRRGRLPRASVRGDPRVSAGLRAARGRRALRRRRVRGRRPAPSARSSSRPACRGYQESMTDPSFAGQLITFTVPARRQLRRLRGRRWSPTAIWARAAIMRAAVNHEDAPSAERGWLDWLRDCGVPAITGVDTRALVRHIRTAGAMRGGVFPARDAGGPRARAGRRRAADGGP